MFKIKQNNPVNAVPRLCLHMPHKDADEDQTLWGSLPVFLSLLGALVVDEQERDQHDARADPVDPARVLGVLDHLADERQRDGQRQADGDDKWGGKQHGEGPGYVADEGGEGVKL